MKSRKQHISHGGIKPKRKRIKKRGVGGNGFKQDGKTPSLDLCDYCYSFCCDPMLMSSKFKAKLDNRTRQNICPSCGNNPCKCKSYLNRIWIRGEINGTK